jgi:hypothetical protein
VSAVITFSFVWERYDYIFIIIISDYIFIINKKNAVRGLRTMASASRRGCESSIKAGYAYHATAAGSVC